MDNNKETPQEQDLEVIAAEDEITKPDESQVIEKQQEGQKLQQEKHEEQLEQKQQAIQEQTAIEEPEVDKQIETSLVKILPEPKQQESLLQQQQQATQLIDYEEEEDEDDDDDDDDEEKETSQKLVIDIPEDEEEEEEEEEKEEGDDEVIALDELPPEEITNKEADKISPKPEEVEAIITLSDGEEELPVTETTAKPGKVQKRRSMGAASVTGSNEEERFRLKRRKINVAGAPKMPLTGYVRYMNDRRESLRKEHPTKTAMEHTKMIGEEWHALPADVKSSYLKAADADKQRYVKELHSFLKSRPDILASELAKNKIRKTAESNSPNPATSTQAAAVSTASTTKSLAKEKATTTNDTNTKTTKDNTKEKMSKETAIMPSTSQQANEKIVNEKAKRKRTPTPPSTSATASNNTTTNASTTASTSSNSTTTNTLTIVTPTPGEIPIFTNEFLEHNKIYDMELRSLRKSKTDLEQQNSVLEKHVENMKFGVEKMITENNELEEKNRLLEIYLDKLKRKLALALSSLPLPSAPNGATVDNIDKYMQDLYKMSTSNSHGPATLNKAKDIIRKLDLQIQL